MEKRDGAWSGLVASGLQDEMPAEETRKDRRMEPRYGQKVESPGKKVHRGGRGCGMCCLGLGADYRWLESVVIKGSRE